MKYCRQCILPDTRPGVSIASDGICSACHGHEDKENKIDWAARAEAFQVIIDDAMARSDGYDCIVPVSGGKDSWYQVIKAREFGLNVLAITWKTPARTEIGQKNLDDMVANLGVDHLDYTINPDVERRFMKAAYEGVGATGLPMHMALFAIPIRLAVQMRIPLILWGENPQLEYGGNEIERLATKLDADWLAKHGCLQSTSWRDWVGKEGLSEQELAAYRVPENPGFDVRSVFLGAFFKWNSYENTRIAEEHGFSYQAGDRKTGTWEFADIDCDFISLHHVTKWQKFGITRAFDNLSVQIRYGQITRAEAIETVRRLGTQIPEEDVQKFCAFQGLPESWFWEVAEKFRNTKIWKRIDGVWQIPGFLIEDWNWGQ
ncbi:N-acetyl sugar amidotransferase [Aestuariispira insulae]|uniref:N-acetyl sugar amidotransferase n=1 Tax=Aestuariispira insulae TaxID=1461337 RepID=A0A3D9HSW4_9PROT|nr:N-acetyl sugar amidotransferase [Aestuariispira insulae]RED52441.1 N-acetyl sugar amidotransferase [Aestuariispira insulae]